MILESDDLIFNSIFFDSTMFFDSANNLIRQTNTVWKTGEIVAESKIVSNKVAYNTERKTWQTERPGGIYQSWDTPSDTARRDRSVW